MSDFDAHRPDLTLAIFRSGQIPSVHDVDRTAERARRLFAVI
jgi:hypothetical protein